jgi:uncharacterized membrane protein
MKTIRANKRGNAMLSLLVAFFFFIPWIVTLGLVAPVFLTYLALLPIKNPYLAFIVQVYTPMGIAMTIIVACVKGFEYIYNLTYKFLTSVGVKDAKT